MLFGMGSECNCNIMRNSEQVAECSLPPHIVEYIKINKCSYSTDLFEYLNETDYNNG